MFYLIIILENTFEVSLNRSSNGLGLSLTGGIAENRPIEVLEIYPNQPAALSGRLNRGDVILSINGATMRNRNVHVCLYSVNIYQNESKKIYSF